MASIRRETAIHAAPAAVWDAVRDTGAIHVRLAPGFLTDCRSHGDGRTVTFADGTTVYERIVDVDDAARRVAWSVVSPRLAHHNASLQVFADGAGSRVVWIADVLPHDTAPRIAGMIELGLAAMARALGPARGE